MAEDRRAIEDCCQGRLGVFASGLESLSPYVAFTNGETHATLDGHFDAEDLRAIADFMTASQPKEKTAGSQ